ncbi:MAG: aspartate kinase, partial [Clostridiales bacterium]|nr:aspartate kinase [Clostridiales bacterium]
KVSKFGGTSLCDAKAVRRAVDIVKSDASRRAVVVSAPGRRFPGDEKITDVLLRLGFPDADREKLVRTVKKRFDTMIKELGLKLDFSPYYAELLFAAERGDTEYVLSRGEYFSARIVSALSGYDFIDAADVIVFEKDGAFDFEKSAENICALTRDVYGFVMPGFYGKDGGGNVKTFPRGGSDITGAIVAGAIGADMYENFTDVRGFMFADPKYVEEPRVIRKMTYAQARFLSAYGSGVLQEDTVLYVRGREIPVNVKSTFLPYDSGTVVCAEGDVGQSGIVGIAGKKLSGERAALAICFDKGEKSVFDGVMKTLASRGIGVKKTEFCGEGAVLYVRGEHLDKAMRALARKYN